VVTRRKAKVTRPFMLLLDKDDQRALHDLAAREKLTLADTVRRMIRAEHQRAQEADRKSAVA
jgi:hypothetical protein